jgi:hypothetical protein
MASKTQRRLEERVVRAAEAALSHHRYVSPIDVLVGMGFLQPSQLEAWRHGRVPYLERVVQANLGMITRAMAIFRTWARARAPKPSQTAYLARTRGPRRELRFSKSGNPRIEEAYRTHYVSAALSEAKTTRLREKLSKAPELVVCSLRGESRCAECGIALGPGDFIFLEADKALCLACADLGHLVYLPSGDATVTRRARGYSQRSAVVVRFSRTRKRYERQGTLVEEAALARAKAECTAEDAVRGN